ncbi:MAG: RNA-binding transcriptional accessory protein [Bacteroidales bacterium]|nr:RNA-binding transcriptional accessory protein [Bacteroidales bacterium]
MELKNYIALIAKETGISEEQIKNTIELIESGATIPFIARYRKEATGNLDEVQIARIKSLHEKWIELDKRRAFILDSISEQGKMTPELELKINNALTMTELEDLYLPYRPKRKTRATIAIEKGLEPLAKMISKQADVDIVAAARKFVNSEKGVENVEEALSGARDIIAEWVSENISIRMKLRNVFEKEAVIISNVVKDKEEEGEKFRIYFDAKEKLSRTPSHRLLAMFRGEEEGILRLSIEPDEERAINMVRQHFVRNNNAAGEQVAQAAKDAYKRLLQPQIETEMRKKFKEKADTEAINVFAANLRQLLMAPPLGQKVVLALDPGFRTGCKLVILDKQGQLLYNETIYPHPPHSQYKLASDKLKRLVLQFQVDAIAIGNGTAGRETEYFVKKIPFERNVRAIVVNESGASVYSASDVAREEFPNYDVTVRGAVSIGRRLMDPLAELVKIDPKSIGVGQYQHDVNQTRLQKSLAETVESCVNKVGVEVNTASKELLSYVSGIGPALAKQIVEYRNTHGAFASREELKSVPRLGAKAFEQSAGFLRIHGAANPLDSSAVHPESYHIVDEMAAKMNCTVSDLIKDESLRRGLNLNDFVSAKAGLPTLKDIMQELAKPGRDPRAQFDTFEFDKNITTINDLKAGMVVPGIITNITNFGCFVDIGVHQDGLVHISQIANKYVRDPNEVVKLNQKVLVKVMSVEPARKRINLSIKEAEKPDTK